MSVNRLRILEYERNIITSLRCMSFDHRDMVLERYDREIAVLKHSLGFMHASEVK